MERVDPAVLQATILLVRRHLTLAEMAERSFLGRKIEYRDHSGPDWCLAMWMQNELRAALVGRRAARLEDVRRC